MLADAHATQCAPCTAALAGILTLLTGALAARSANPQALLLTACWLRGSQPFLHESRHAHATKRERGPGGRFLSAAERGAMEQLVQMQGGGGARAGGPAPSGVPRPSGAPGEQGARGSGPPQEAPPAGAPAEQGRVEQCGQAGGPVPSNTHHAAASAAKQESAEEPVMPLSAAPSHGGPASGHALAAVPVAEAAGGAATGAGQAVSAAS